MNITSKNGLALLKDLNKEEKDYHVVFVFDDGSERCFTCQTMKLNHLSDILEVAQESKDIIKVEIFEYVKSTSVSVRPINCTDIIQKRFEPKCNRTSRLRTRVR